ncbi:MAG TPA: zinc ribbon domain-containing protein [Methylomirabilota bacterium]|nr:zinc ribbon domain-containing protein [Methylomirabilota bacterium]
MTCPKCRTAVPDQSVFCLACGARVAPSLTVPGANGTVTAPPAVAPPPSQPGGKQPYALSFGRLMDERLRYRVAKWVVERAPAHGLTEVQEDLEHGTFVTFLALTAHEAEVARQGIHGLGVAPPLLRLAPATTAEMLLPTRRTRPEGEERRSIGFGSWRTLVAAAVGLLLFGLVVVRLIGGRGF